MPSRNANTLVLSTALGWAAGLFLAPILIGTAIRWIESALGIQLFPDFGGALCNLFLGPVAGGAIGGYFTASILRRFPTLQTIRTRSIVLIWAWAMLVGAISMFIFTSLFLLAPPQP